MSHLSPENITHLHSRHALASDGTPAMTHCFERYLSQQGPSRPGTPPAPLSFTEAWARLRAEEPHRAAAVVATVAHRLTVRDAAPVLGVASATVSRRTREGLAALIVWTGLPRDVVACQVCDLTA